MGWGGLQPDTKPIRERHQKKKRKEEKEKKQKERRKELDKDWKKAKKEADNERMKEVNEEKARLKKIARMTELKKKARELKSDKKIQTGDLDLVLSHIDSHQGIKYVDMISIWDDELGLITKIGDARLSQCLSWLQEQGLIAHDPDYNGAMGHAPFYTTEYLHQLKQRESGADTCQQDVSKVSSDEGGA